MTRFKTMLDSRICFILTKVRLSFFLDTFSLQSKQLEPDYVSSHKKPVWINALFGLIHHEFAKQS